MSKTEKLFTVAGTAKNADGTVKARFANDLVARIKILNKAGCTDINLVELPQAMTKLDAIKHIATLDEFNTAGSKAAIMDYLDRKDSAPKAKAPAVKAPKAVKAKAAVTEDEDAPF